MSEEKIELPRGRITDRLLKQKVKLSDSCSGCTYQGYEFGANYPDSVCIEGYLWDADSGDADPTGEGWIHTNGGDIPCPWCNHIEWANGAIDEARDAGLNAQSEGALRTEVPKAGRFKHLTSLIRESWIEGWDEGYAFDARNKP